LSLFNEITISNLVTPYTEIGRTDIGGKSGGSENVGKSRASANEKPHHLPTIYLKMPEM